MNSKNLILILFLAFATPIFAQNADMSLIPYRKGDLWGYAYPDKSIAIKPQFEDANLFHEGYASVKKEGKYGYIDKTGKVVIPFRYYSAKPFREGYYPLLANEKPGDGSLNAQKTVLFAGVAPASNGVEICIDTKGKQLLKCPAINDNSAPDVNKPNTITTISNYSTIQKTDLFDKIIDDYKMPGAEETYYVATRNNMYGVFNKTFEVIVPFEYTKIEKFNISLMVYLQVEKNGLKGVLFGNGSLYMAVENSRLDRVEAKDGNTYFIFTKDGETGVKNSRYKVVVDPQYSDISYDKAGGFILTGGNNMKGFCFLNGNIIKPSYADIMPIGDGAYIKVKTIGGKWGYVEDNSQEFFEE